MFNQSRTSRMTLLAVSRILLQSAEAARSVPALIPNITAMEEALTVFQARHTASITTADRFQEQHTLAQQAEEDADRRVTSFAGRLQGEAKGGDPVAEAAMRRLFPKGVSRLTHYTGRVQLTHYQIFREQLSLTPLPSLLAQEPVRISAALDGLVSALALKEEIKAELRTAQLAARQAEEALQRALQNLERASSIYLSAEQLRAWSEPARSLGRRTQPQKVAA